MMYNKYAYKYEICENNVYFFHSKSMFCRSCRSTSVSPLLHPMLFLWKRQSTIFRCAISCSNEEFWASVSLLKTHKVWWGWRMALSSSLLGWIKSYQKVCKKAWIALHWLKIQSWPPFILSMPLGYRITRKSGKLFLSWQTWDLMRLMYYGFRNFCADFTTAHPGYTIYPVRLNGSAVETFFSQVKHATSGHLSSVNYATARGAVLTRGSIHGKMRRHRGDYRDAPLFNRQHPLKRKSYKWLKK